MKAYGFKRFYGDGVLIGYAIGPAESVTLIVDNSQNQWREINSVWCGRVQNFDAIREFLATLGPEGVGHWKWSIHDLGLDPDTAKRSVKHVYVALSGREQRRVVIECKDVAES